MKKCVGLLSAVMLVCVSSGSVLAEDVERAEDLPEPVRSTLMKEAQGAIIEDVEREKHAGKTVYEVELERNNEEWDLTIDEKGKVIEREREMKSKSGTPQQMQPQSQQQQQPQAEPQTQQPSQTMPSESPSQPQSQPQP